jgi:predicted nucleic acid-binding protein
MGLILDSSILIAGERRGEGVREILKRMQAAHGETESGLSAVTVVELTHGIYRAKSDGDRERRRAFTEELFRDMTVHPVTLEIAKPAGKDRGRTRCLRSEHRIRRSLDWHNSATFRLFCCHSQRSSLPHDPRSVGCTAVAENYP